MNKTDFHKHLPAFVLGIFCLVIVASFAACSDDKDEDEHFNQVDIGTGHIGDNTGETSVTAGVGEYTASTATLYGYINASADAMRTAEFGFIWTRSTNELTMNDNEGSVRCNETTGNQYYTTISKLTPGRKYYYRSYVRIGDNIVYGVIKNFKCLVPETTVSAEAQRTSALLKGSVNVTDKDPYKAGFKYSFNKEKDPQDGTIVRSTSLVIDGKNFQQELTGLGAGKTVYYCSFVTIGDTTIYSSTKNFTTDDIKVETLPAKSVGCYTVEFESKLEDGLSLIYQVSTDKENWDNVLHGWTYVQPGQKYYYRARYDEMYGEIMTFTVPYPELKIEDLSNIKTHTATVNFKTNMTDCDITNGRLLIYTTKDESNIKTSPANFYTISYREGEKYLTPKNLGDGRYSVEINRLEYSMTYYVAVVTYDSGGITPNKYFSNIESFTTNIFDFNNVEYIDLGLPSRTIWMKDKGKSSWYSTIPKLGGEWQLPSKEDYEELMKYCTKAESKSSVKLVGPNGNTIYFSPSEIYWINVQASYISYDDRGNISYGSTHYKDLYGNARMVIHKL